MGPNVPALAPGEDPLKNVEGARVCVVARIATDHLLGPLALVESGGHVQVAPSGLGLSPEDEVVRVHAALEEDGEGRMCVSSVAVSFGVDVEEVDDVEIARELADDRSVGVPGHVVSRVREDRVVHVPSVAQPGAIPRAAALERTKRDAHVLLTLNQVK